MANPAKEPTGDVFPCVEYFFIPDVDIILFLRWNIFIPGLEKTLNFIPHASIPPEEYFYSGRGIVLNRGPTLIFAYIFGTLTSRTLKIAKSRSREV